MIQRWEHAIAALSSRPLSDANLPDYTASPDCVHVKIRSREEQIRTRDHTEMALREFGADITSIGDTWHGRPNLNGNRELTMPGDIPSEPPRKRTCDHGETEGWKPAKAGGIDEMTIHSVWLSCCCDDLRTATSTVRSRVEAVG